MTAGELGTQLALKGKCFGWSVDNEKRMVTYYVPENEPLPGFPHRVEHYDVRVVPLPPAKEHLRGESLSQST